MVGRYRKSRSKWTPEKQLGKAGTRLRIYLAHLDSTLSSKTKWAMCEFKWRPWMLIDIGYFQVWRLHSGRFHTLIVHVQQMRSLTRHILGVKGHSRFLYKTRLYKQYGTELTLVRLSLWFEQIRKVYLPHSKLVCSTPRSAKLTAWTNLVEYDRRLLPLINVLCPTRVDDFFQWPYTYTSQTIEQSGPRLADGFVRKQVRNIQYYTLYLCRCRSCFLSSYTIS